MNFSATFLIFVVERFNTLDAEAHHGLIADFSREVLVVHARDVKICVAAIDARVVRRRCVAKGFLEAADFCPPLQRLRGIGGGENRNCALDDWIHMVRITEFGG